MRRLGGSSISSLSVYSSVGLQHQQPEPEQQQQQTLQTTTTACSFFNAQNILPGSSSSLSSSSSSSSSLVVVSPTSFISQRFLRVAKSPHGYYISRRGRFAQHWPQYRKPHYTHPQSGIITPPWHWKRGTVVDPNEFLPKQNYVTGPWVGLFFMHLHQVYTLQHCNAGVPIRVKRFPTAFEFKEHSRWMIGKAMRNWVEPRAHIFDEAALTKKARLDLVKKGLLPPG